jgi:hypothetical protein
MYPDVGIFGAYYSTGDVFRMAAAFTLKNSFSRFI